MGTSSHRSFEREFVFCCCSSFQDKKHLRPWLASGRSHAITRVDYSNPWVTGKSIRGFPVKEPLHK